MAGVLASAVLVKSICLLPGSCVELRESSWLRFGPLVGVGSGVVSGVGGNIFVEEACGRGFGFGFGFCGCDWSWVVLR